ncbi:PREDICTED: organic cation transporter protein isoform X1 [Polistes canadensis]|uniref:organic cation transporter protein isoform X1 n=1 Tax=Polistes canadensis TaxID=91411 RepID=UPI00071906F1|nr:PREDICTED: organic cation transporter protein isoform X1 [Polistes canadensis]XP_014611289.1 PREDICTED: organic cation transporter protein isoform X1 [Polistes canadensis]
MQETTDDYQRQDANNVDEKTKKTNDEEGFDLDDLLPIVGEFGRYQKQLLWLVCLPACLPCGFCAFNQLFMADTPAHWCKVPGLENMDISRRRRLAIPTSQDDNETYSQCTRYDVDWTTENASNTRTNSSWSIVPCDHGWEYDTSDITSSIVIDFDLVCERAIYPTIGLVALNTGGPIGVYLFGSLNDRIGRRLSFFTCLATLITGGFLTSISNSFWTWAATRMVVGLTIPAIYQIPFIISLELVGPNYRSFVTVMTCSFYTMGLCMLAGVTYLIRDWRILAITTSAPFLLYFFYWWFLPESPRWLLAKGRLVEANDILETLARVNGKELPASFTQKLRQRMTMSRTKSEEERLRNGPGVLSLFKTPNMRLKTCLITLNWFANNMVYVGLSYYGPALGNEEHLSFLFSSLAEIPSYMACWVVMDRWGRRWPLCLCMVVAGVSCIATVLLSADAVVATLVLFLLSKSAISASFLIIYPFAGELYPTQLRGVAIGFSAYISGLGLIIIPFVTYLGKENLVLPLVIFGCVSVIGGLSGLRLPETLHHRLPQTVEEGELFGKDWTCADCIRCIPTKPSSAAASYEDLSARETVEMHEVPELPIAQTIPTQAISQRILEEQQRPSSASVRRLVRQSSVMDTQRDSDGSIKMTYWF